MGGMAQGSIQQGALHVSPSHAMCVTEDRRCVSAEDRRIVWLASR